MSLSKRSLFTIIQAAEILGVSPKTIRRLKSKGVISPQTGSNRQILISINDLDILRNVLNKPLANKTYPVADTAKMLNVSPDTIRRWEKEGKIESIRTTGGHRRFTTEAIRQVKEKKDQPQTKVAIPSQPFSKNFFFNLKLISFVILSTFLITIAMGPAFIASKLTFLQQSINQLQTRLTQITREESGYPEGNFASVLSSSEGVYEGDVQIIGQVSITGQTVFDEYVKFKKGAEFGSSTLIIDGFGNLDTDKTITTENLVVKGATSLSKLSVAGNEIINSSGKIPVINGLYFESLSGENLTDIDAHHLNGVAASSFLRSDQSDTAEGVINFTASPGSTNVNGGPVYINPASSTSDYTLFGIALGGSQRFKVDAEGDVVTTGNIQISSTGKQFKLSTNTSDPTALGSGSLYFNTSSSKLRVYTGSSWSDISGDMTGSGTANYLSKWTASNTLGDSVIQESSGQIGIGVSPSQTLDVDGDIRIRGGEIYLDGLSSSSSTTDGTIYFDTDDNNLYIYANSAYNKIGSDLTKYTANNAALANAGYLEVAHNEGTNDIMVSGWIYDGSKYIEIDDHAQATLNIQDPNLVGWYKMEEASGDLDNAEGTASRDLIDKGTPTYAQTGQINSAISLDGTSDYFCTGTGTTCADNDDFDFGSSSFSIGGWFKHDTISTNSDYIAVKYSDSASIDSGDGDDGAITVSVSSNINTADLISGRTCTEGGDAVNYNVSALTSTTATLTSTPSAGCLAIGDEVLLINLQGGTSAYSNVGNYETLRIQGIAGAVVTFTTSKLNYYGDGASDDTNLGTATGTQRVMLQRVPNYTSVTVNDAINFYPDDWDGVKGGVMFFRATGAVAINGTGKIHADAKGYRRGVEGSGNFLGGGGGEAFCGPTDTAGGDGGDYLARNGSNGNCGGGGGSAVNDTSQGTPGTGSASAGGAGGGGGAAEDGNSTGQGRGGGGGGGGYGTIGYKGTNYNSGGTPGDGGTNSSGNGGKGYGSGDNQYGGMGGGGGTYGDADLTDLFFGSSGGAGGDGDSYPEGCMEGGHGGDGGGIIFIAADSITVNGFLSSNGNNGAVGESDGVNRAGGGGGGGAGGSMKLISNTINLGTSKVTATGGAGGNGAAADGGAAGDGRIHVDYVTSTSGTSDPVYDSSQVSASAGGYKLYMESDGDITFAIDDDQSSFPEDSATTTPANYDDNSWHHLAVVKSGASYIKIYIDGQEVAADYSLAATTSISNDDPFYLGVDSDGSSNPWQGVLDEMFVLSRDLSAGEIKELYQSNNRFYIEQTDNNTVRLYNYTGETQNVRLDVLVFGADLAEWYPTDDDSIEAGDVVKAIGEKDKYGVPKITKTDIKGDNKAIGIISTRAGVELGLSGPDRHLVALSGRVPVKIEPDSPTISAGDFITASDSPGYARKAEFGDYYVGKALGSWEPDSGKSTVTTFLTLGFLYADLNQEQDQATAADTKEVESGQEQTETNLSSIDYSYEERIRLLEENLEKLNKQVSGLTDLYLSSTSLSETSNDIPSSSIDSLVVLGKSTLGDTFINGKLNVGILSFDNLTASIDAIGVLKIQPLALGNIEFMNGLVTIDTSGNMIVNEITAKKYKVSGNSAGSDYIGSGQTSVWVETDTVRSNSLIFITPTTITDSPLSVTEKSSGSGFRVETEKSTDKNIHFDWWIIESE